MRKADMLFLVAYDIPDDGTRTQIANELENWVIGFSIRFLSATLTRLVAY